jgi:ABC-type transport system involved in multi-copper enzyme maturation permease subunit
MAQARTKIFTGFLGPIFDKELRVSSRRKKNYALRFVYVIVLIIFVAAVWSDVVRFSGSISYQKGQMARAAQNIVATIEKFQFIAAQVIVIIMLSTAINDEILHRTLGVLMTTPISGFQIVTGKLSSKLLQIILLLAISLPLLVIVRSFGGVNLISIISSFCITLTTVIFVGSLSLFFSIFSRRTYIVIIFTVLTLGILFWLPLVSLKHWFFLGRFHLYSSFVYIANPYKYHNLCIDFISQGFSGWSILTWLIHCIFMLVVSTIILLLSAFFVRRAAIAQITGKVYLVTQLRRVIRTVSFNKIKPEKSDGLIRSVKGPPVVWKEMISRFSSREKIFVGTIIAVELIMIGAIYIFPYVVHEIGLKNAHILYFETFAGLGLLSAIILSASCITAEKEAGTWPLLLTTTLEDREILFGKLIGVLRHVIPSWVLLFIYLIPLWDIYGTNLYGLFYLIALVLVTGVFFCGLGFYFSSRFKHSNTAITANFIIAALLGFIIPFLSSFFIQSFRMEPEVRRVLKYLSTSPIEQAISVMKGDENFVSIHLIYIMPLLGFVFVWLGMRRFRRDVF